VRQISLLLVLALAACSQASSDVIILGAGGGWTEARGEMARKGIELALAELNAESGKAPVQVIYKDDQMTGSKAALVAQEFVASDSVVAVIGHLTSGAMKAAAKVYDGHLPAVATAASSPELTGISPWAFRIISSDSTSGIEIGRFATKLGRRRAMILYENSAYGRGLADAFRKNFEGEVVGIDPIAEGKDQNFEPYVSWIRARRPDVVFVAGNEPSALPFLREVRRQRVNADLMGGVGWRSIASDAALSQGVWVGVPFSAEDSRPAVRTFVAAFKAKYGSTPDAGAALAYDATKVLAEAARTVGPDRAKIRDWLAATATGRPFAGVTGDIQFNSGGDPMINTFVMTRIADGALAVEGAR
jgi:branched-chain amino acid transport system substrate-binding protein